MKHGILLHPHIHTTTSSSYSRMWYEKASSAGFCEFKYITFLLLLFFVHAKLVLCIYRCVHAHSSYMTLIGVHKMHIECMICLSMAPFLIISSIGYPMIIYTHPVDNDLTIKTLVAKRYMCISSYKYVSCDNAIDFYHVHL